jgi:hypothetical protein
MLPLNRMTRARICASLLAVVASVATLGAADLPSDDEALLGRSDASSASPRSFRAELRITAPERPQGALIEVWRSGETQTLVRFLDQKERGKYLLYRGNDVWFLAPRATQPVKLPSSFRLRGCATLDDLLGLHYSRDYSIRSVEKDAEDGDLVVFDLEAKAKKAVYPRIRYVVRRSDGHAVRAEYRLRGGKASMAVEFNEWDGWRARKVTLKDLLRAGAITIVELLAIEARAVPPGLFDRDDPAERRKLEAAAP